VSIYLILIFAAISQALLRAFHDSIFYAFTNDEAVIAEIEATWNIFLIFVIFDQIYGIASSSFVATGRQLLGGLITWIGYFFIGLSLMSYNVFYRDSSLAGIWVGAIAAVGFNSAAFLLSSCTTNWD
jgi:Na+-driven multidrug efflux pump